MDRSKTKHFHLSNDPVAAYEILYVGRKASIAALAVLIYEKFIILEEEIDLVWCKRRSWVTILYFVNSWLAPLWLASELATVDLPKGTPAITICTVSLLGSNIVTLVMTLSVQAAMHLRVWAVYERTRKMLWFLVILFCAECIAMVILLAIMIAHLSTLPIISTPVGCAFETLPRFSSLFWVPAIAIEPILCVLVLKKAVGLLHARTGLSALLARDSLIYFFAISAGLLSLLVAWLIDPLNLEYFFPWAIAFPSLFGGRLLLNIRRHFESVQTWGEIEMTVYSATQAQTGNVVPDGPSVPAVSHSVSQV